MTFDDFGYMSGQVALLLLVAVVFGVVLGRYAWPRRPHRQDPPSTAAESTPSGIAPDAAQGRGAHAEAQLHQAQAWATGLEAQLKESQSMLQKTRRRLGQADTELIRIRLQVRELEHRKEAEMGRLESGAIAALESTIATHREQVATLEEKLRAAETTAEEHVQELAVERRRSAQLQSALTERYQHITTLMSERER